MSSVQTAHLHDRGIVAVSGGDAEHFLQGLVTNDVLGLAEGTARFAGLLSPQGKIQFEFFIVPHKDGFLLDASAEKVGELAKRLLFYKLRADVAIADLSNDHLVVAQWMAGDGGPADFPPLPALVVFDDPRHAKLGRRGIVPTSDQSQVESGWREDTADYHAHRIRLGIPEGGLDYPLGDTFPHEACWDDLAGVDFEKGCFVGQEVVSRMQHRGTARRRAIPVEAAYPLPAPGTEINAGDVPVGLLGSSADTLAIAMLRLDRVAKAFGQATELDAAGVKLWPRQPNWASFEVPVAPAPVKG